MTGFAEKLLRTYIELVRHSSKPELAALVVDAELVIEEVEDGYLRIVDLLRCCSLEIIGILNNDSKSLELQVI
ncbi:hypothetical protein V2H45_04210 [Tumidithrix elongata RA019]|uniref:Uncharacterized protein n=1 Tax=Tumidithrix elongata BACA0141 TaxID=2716417 RepID=A0AAW9PZN1_9CYAN|nr:hypothetical protein [Tumidithrix elongata RA019]